MRKQKTPVSEVEPKRSVGIQRRLVMLLLAVLIPILGIQALIYCDRFQSRRAEVLKANLEVAHAVASAFEAFVQDILHQEVAIGLTATSSPSLSAMDFTRLLQESARNIPAVRDFFWFSPQGRILASSTPGAIGMDGSDRKWYQDIAGGKEWVVSDLLKSKLTGKPTFAICRGIRNENGVLLGLVVAVIVPEKLDSILGFKRLGDAGVSILDSKGMNIFRHPHIAYTWEQRNWLKHYPVLEGALKGSDIVTTVISQRNGIERLGAFAPIPLIGWVSASSRALDEAMESLESDLIRHGVMFFGVAFASVFFALWISRTIARPMEKIHKHVLSLGRGKWDSGFEVTGPREVQALADALNWMSLKHKHAEEALRQKEEEFRALVENAPDVISLFDRQLRRVYVNSEIRENTGQKASFMVGKSLLEAGYPDSFALTFNTTLQNVFTTGREETVELYWEGPKGPIWLQIRCAPLRAADGSVEQVMSIGRDITALKTAENTLKASLAEKEVLLKEIHHRVKNNLQVISSLVDLQSNEVNNEAMRDVFRDVVFRVRSMAMVHEKLYQSGDFAHVDFADYANSFISYLWRAQGVATPGVQLNLNLEPVLLPVNKAIPCGLMLNELFINALKHAFVNRKKGTVTVSLHIIEQEKVVLTVKDDGIGLPPEMDIKKAHSLGLRLVQMLARQVQASVETIIDNGTTFTIMFKMNEQ